MGIKQSFSEALLQWYDASRRSLPWRGSMDPYVIWVSEIIFQQTRISQGTSYFLRFMERFPDIQTLATAQEEEVLKVWQGLGYYSRARNMHFTAKQVVEVYGGLFPREHGQISALKGIGDYTASCITSICFNQPDAAVDGNVYRVLSRLKADATPVNSSPAFRIFKGYASELIDPSRPGDFNEAMMDLGALICTPANPFCGQCPVSRFCLAFSEGTQASFPAKSRMERKGPLEINYLLVESLGRIMIRKRTGPGIWKGLYDLPEVKSPDVEPVVTVLHPLTHRDLKISFYKDMDIPADIANEPDIQWVEKTELGEYPFPKPIADFLAGEG
jgi:A/G-specific adenine glycosylase